MAATDLRRFMAIHEAGHAVVAMALGKDVNELRIEATAEQMSEMGVPAAAGGGYCSNYKPNQWRSWHACSSLGGVFACAIHCRDFEDFAELNSWAHCSRDRELFEQERGGMSFRAGRRLTLQILRDRKEDLLALAEVLERDGFVDHANAPEHMRGD